jgi:hypothetical protein
MAKVAIEMVERAGVNVEQLLGLLINSKPFWFERMLEATHKSRAISGRSLTGRHVKMMH